MNLRNLFMFGLTATLLSFISEQAFAQQGPSCLGEPQQSGEDNSLPFVVSPLSIKVRRKVGFYKSRGQPYNIPLARNCNEAILAAKSTVSLLNGAGRVCNGGYASATYQCTPNLMNYPTVCETGLTVRVEDTWTIKVTFSCN